MGSVNLETEEKMYEAVVTNLGNELMMDAVVNGPKVAITEFAVGDGGGEYYKPETSMTELKNEVWRGTINSCEISSEASNIMIVTAICPGEVGDFTIREMAVFDADNNMIAICNCPATPKVTVTDGVVNEIYLEMEVALVSADAVEFIVDPNIITATQKDIQEIMDIIEMIKQSFQDGCDTLVSACTTYGATPASNSPSDISAAIKKIYDDRYSDGRTKGQEDVITNPSEYGLSIKTGTYTWTFGGSKYSTDGSYLHQNGGQLSHNTGITTLISCSITKMDGVYAYSYAGDNANTNYFAGVNLTTSVDPDGNIYVNNATGCTITNYYGTGDSDYGKATITVTYYYL